MNLAKLFEIQKVLDEKIIREKVLEGQDLLPQKILALQVELGELANEWRGFKFWSKDQEPRGEMQVQCPKCHGEGTHGALGDNLGYMEVDCTNCDENCEITINPLLEEYVDCLHFILSIGLSDSELMLYDYDYLPDVERNGNITRQFSKIFYHISFDEWEVVLTNFLGLGEMLGFTWEQIEQAYMDKNVVNHERQQNGY